MGFVRPRVRDDGVVRFQALYDDVKGRRRSAGTFDTEDLATRALHRIELRLADGRHGDARRGRQKFRKYVLEEWLPNHLMEARTRENYTYYIERHLLPVFGGMKMAAVLPGDVREWINDLKEQGASPTVIKMCHTVMSAIFTTALNDQIVQIHPCRGVKTPPIPRRIRAIITPEQFDDFYAALRGDAARLLAELDIESGLRWGELTELRPADFNMSNHILTVSRVAVELVPRFHPNGERFLVKEYPKDEEDRRLKLSTAIVEKVHAHTEHFEISPYGLLFTVDQLRLGRSREACVGSAQAGLTKPNAAGRQYPHGTLSGYSAGRCHCARCRGAYAIYRARRRAAGMDDPRPPRRSVDTDGHIPRRWFREAIWLPAVAAAGISVRVRPNDLRHAHASWLLAGGADLQVVKERLGHGSIVTTEKYLHTLADADDTALDALAAIRRRGRSGST